MVKSSIVGVIPTSGDSVVVPVVCGYHTVCDGHALFFTEPSLTKQSFKDECDINLIVERAQSSGFISNVNVREARYGDFSDVPDFMTALNTVRDANDMFMALPAKLRERFSNDPSKMISFLQDPANRDEGVLLGLLKAPGPAKAPDPAPPQAPDASKV